MECPNCHSTNIKNRPTWTIPSILISIFLVGLLVSTSHNDYVSAGGTSIAVLTSFLALASVLVTLTGTYKCKDCRHQWK